MRIITICLFFLSTFSVSAQIISKVDLQNSDLLAQEILYIDGIKETDSISELAVVTNLNLFLMWSEVPEYLLGDSIDVYALKAQIKRDDNTHSLTCRIFVYRKDPSYEVSLDKCKLINQSNKDVIFIDNDSSQL